ncbi:ChrR family anti-sigma-E factor [Oceanicella actignis]|uniref:Anti-ECFsigma factor, ChrR n=1 Tax=Oceanicella actignis TaxID=1189325 RepID=A0A1M7TVE8_9RHOB|nr:ChrR family anti-sigma-E factor [Oceanicella actignis]TYO90447.1 ChrR-like anti-ECFsigma factor [Oceanicella actignis]SES80243.1 anti-ECFsigma factor, ChrR [Oceanicella actignis]SHN74699.1 anti-ECFsigma factor, ChrR [Oceanicella actignis]
MTHDVTHHIPEPMLADYAAGRLGHAFSVATAAHVSLCDECRARLAAHEAAGGAVLETLPPEPVSDELMARVMARLDDPAAAPPEPPRPSGIYPGPVMAALGGRPPRWRSMGAGIRQAMLHAGPDGSLRLLYIPPGRAVPDHGHKGRELTLVLQGAFHDETGRFGVGDVEYADESLEHTPVADEGAPCICLAATDAPLRFRGLIPRALQPIFRI